MNNSIVIYSAISNPTLLFSRISYMNESYTVKYLRKKIINSKFKGSYTKFTTFKAILEKSKFVHTYV